ncbi:hypothetical protein JRQ81_008491 [Phrynocephalus forsythii]|uniref:Uncharacterized protein n=1 Tax=Phrynocephalus forsythii TaxID=171643 RepID=A0A9Q0XAR5_9SAUR|nr:hypothetical protein JRQ81_008491 [Phrynocephalus forsythii]
MKVPCPFSCVLLISFGVCFPPDGGQELRAPGSKPGGAPGQPGLLQACEMPKGLFRCCPQDLCSLLAKWPPGFGKEKAAVRSRLRRRPGGRDPGNEAIISYLPEEDGEKRAGPLGSLAEELSGYDRKKGGFNFRFGRGKKNDNSSWKAIRNRVIFCKNGTYRTGTCGLRKTRGWIGSCPESMLRAQLGRPVGQFASHSNPSFLAELNRRHRVVSTKLLNPLDQAGSQ